MGDEQGYRPATGAGTAHRYLFIIPLAKTVGHPSGLGVCALSEPGALRNISIHSDSMRLDV